MSQRCLYQILDQSIRNGIQSLLQSFAFHSIILTYDSHNYVPSHYRHYENFQICKGLTLMTRSTRDCILSEADNAADKWGEYLVLWRNPTSAYDRVDDVISRSSKANLRLRDGLGERYDETNDAGSVAERLWRPRLRVVLLLGKSTEYFQAKPK
jgi:hypothetical protein